MFFPEHSFEHMYKHMEHIFEHIEHNYKFHLA